MSVPARISLITLGVRDVSRATEFYEALGWRRASASTADVTFIQTADSVLALWSAGALAADFGHSDATAPAFRGVSLAINVESESEVERIVAEMAQAGAAVVKEPGPVFWGGYTAHVTDPDGHAWEIAHNPGFAFAPDGSLQL
ncbi:MAG TPA: VOC family protein [Mycobacteriales bacterium]|nr:VOC family protein [Mycobacteriales bacterium]